MEFHFKRILLKLSGEALMGDQGFGIDSLKLKEFSQEISSVVKLGVQVAVVIGGGNIYRGVQIKDKSIDRVQGDHMGMLATVINGLALQSSLEELGLQTRLQTAVKIEAIAEPYIRRRALRHLEKGRIVIFSSGTGNPFFTTDTAAALRANEIEADIILKGTRVDGVYNSDPEINKEAYKYDNLSFDDVINRRLKVMDSTAFTLSRENKIPILVFDMNRKGNLLKIISGEKIGTLIDK